MKVITSIEYEDLTGRVRTELIKERNVQTMVLRGITFINNGSDGFIPTLDHNSKNLSTFMLEDGVLCGFSIRFLEKRTRALWGNNEGHFKRLNVLLDKLDAEIDIEDQLESLIPFKSLNKAQIKALATAIKDEEAGMALYFIGSSKMDHIFPELLSNIQDQNWPAFSWNLKLLVEIGEKLIPEIKNIFKTEVYDTIWHRNIIWGLENWERDSLLQLKSELIDTVLKADFDDASITALRLLYSKQILIQSEIIKYYDFLEEKYANNEDMIEDLKELKLFICSDEINQIE